MGQRDVFGPLAFVKHIEIAVASDFAFDCHPTAVNGAHSSATFVTPATHLFDKRHQVNFCAAAVFGTLRQDYFQVTGLGVRSAFAESVFAVAANF